MLQSFHPLATLIARLFLAALFLLAGLGKITGYEATQAYMESGGVPGILLPLVILLEVGGGLLLAIGYQARLVALLLAGFSVLAAILYHADFGNQIQMAMFLKNLAVAGGLLLIFVYGPGSYKVGKDQPA